MAAKRVCDLVVCCAEGRPALEGRGLAESLASHGVDVELYTDAALGGAVGTAQAVLIGADAIGPVEFLNKAGTSTVCALAAVSGVPVYVLSGREKIVTAQVFEELEIRSGREEEVWNRPPIGVRVQNPYFDRTPLSLVTSLITEAGVVPPDQVGDLIYII
jgi:translation initiation factor 2B subunit (eIF-2B alpha/beta/delta family)